MDEKIFETIIEMAPAKHLILEFDNGLFVFGNVCLFMDIENNLTYAFNFKNKQFFVGPGIPKVAYTNPNKETIKVPFDGVFNILNIFRRFKFEQVLNITELGCKFYDEMG